MNIEKKCKACLQKIKMCYKCLHGAVYPCDILSYHEQGVDSLKFA
jgi:hypothetical protein